MSLKGARTTVWSSAKSKKKLYGEYMASSIASFRVPFFFVGMDWALSTIQSALMANPLRMQCPQQLEVRVFRIEV